MKKSENVGRNMNAGFFESRLFSNLFIPVLYLFVVLVLDIIFYVSLGWAFPHMYIFSFGITIIFALLVSCIPSRIAQICIFTLFLGLRAFALVGNVIASESLNELFILESLRGTAEMLQFGDVGYIPFLLTVVVVLIVVGFLVASIFLHKYFKRMKLRSGYGYNMRGLVASFVAVVMIVSTVGVSFVRMAPIDQREGHFFTNNLDNDRFILSTFLNRHAFLQRFGPTMFYITNVLEILSMRPVFGMTIPQSSGSWNEWSTEILGLDENYNLIMIMMETIEFDAINPLVTPNLWRLKSMSTWVDGYFGVERTVMPEYVALTGSHTMGQEMWFTYTHNDVPQSLPNIFRRMGYDQMGSFHNFRANQFRRDQLFPAMGFCWYRTTNHYIPDSISGHTNRNSDFLLFDVAIDDIAPYGKTFMNYVLTVSGHHGINIHLQNKYENGQPVYADLPAPHQRRAFTTNIDQHTQNFLVDIDAIAGMEYYLAQFFPKLAVGTDFERIAAFQYLVKVHNLDRGIGRLLQHLEETPDFRHPCGTVKLIDTTALVLYSDHFNHSWYGHRYNPGGGKLSNTNVNRPLGEQLVFMLYNPREADLRKNALPSGWRWNGATEFFSTRPFNPVIYANDPGTRVEPPIDGIGRRIERFMSNIDIYPTVAHLFGFRTHTNVTLGVSVLEKDSFSIGIGFISGGLFFGLCPETRQPWATRDMVNFGIRHFGQTTAPTNDAVIAQIRDRINDSMNTMHLLRIFFEANAFPDYAYYVFG
ncbi:MAG: sulfatase-like hydrolase/transferase [Firmicutes bacterium]|nr:sulfatase-like hydrolase/transferase [Bacillota bacterium]